MNTLGTATIFTTKGDLQAAVPGRPTPTQLTPSRRTARHRRLERLAHHRHVSELFLGLLNFNADISNWNTSSVTSMRAMFEFASSASR